MRVVRTAAGLRAELATERAAGKRIGFVPTMGALHDGHLSLVAAIEDECDVIVMSIFVNPLQFGPKEDLTSYPRNDKKDLTFADGAGVDVVFLPTVEEMYREGRETKVSVGRLGSILEGADRPGHFDGVATVVAKLFNIVLPDVAVFGQKDAQQVAVIHQLVRDLSYDVDIKVAPTVRQDDGLALSSRNAYLSPDERIRATGIHRALQLGARTLGEEGIEAAEKNMWELLLSEGLEPSYARAVDPDTFGPPAEGGDVLLVIAAHLGGTRLIDNMLVGGV